MKEMLSKEHVRFLNSQKRRKVFVLLAQIGTLVAVLALWELLAQTGVIDAFITSCPSKIWATFV
ncbi:MAG: ABC transporter permease, partial [Clostridia bacterium]|nr:ABC transporter permease [Clostridia bacterium]